MSVRYVCNAFQIMSKFIFLKVFHTIVLADSVELPNWWAYYVPGSIPGFLLSVALYLLSVFIFAHNLTIFALYFLIILIKGEHLAELTFPPYRSQTFNIPQRGRYNYKNIAQIIHVIMNNDQINPYAYGCILIFFFFTYVLKSPV